jgi:Tfp pilus assembly protein PilF
MNVMNSDRYGLALATASSQAAAAYRSGVDLLLSGYPGAEARFEEALAYDPDFALAHAALARQLQIYARVAQAREAIARARALAAKATTREQAHVRILELAINGQPAGALAALLEHLEAHPRDALAASLAFGAFGLYAFSGRPDHDAARLALGRRLAPHYGEDWWFLTHLGWSHTEAGELAAGELVTARALELRRENAYGAHAYVHFFVEAGKRNDGERFVEDWLPGYDRGGLLHGHINWHRALWRLDEGDAAGAAAIYAEVLHPAVNTSPPINVISDCASLLWRLSIKNNVAEWREVADYGQERFPRPAGHFIEWHLAMAAAGAGQLAALEQRLGILPEAPPGPVFRAACAGFRAFAAGDYAAVVALLEPMTAEFKRMGGSGAQRQVLFDTLTAARARAAAG